MKKQFSEELSRNGSKLDNAYDLAAFCYDYLIDKVKNQAQFIGKYICKNEDARENNPNLDKLFRFKQSMKRTLCKQQSGFDYLELRDRIENQVKETEDSLEEYGEKEMNNAAIPFFILLAIDSYALERKGDCIGRSPLNQKYKKKSYVYLNVTDAPVDGAVKRRKIKDAVICDQIEHLIFLEKKLLPPEIKKPPQIVSLYIGESDTVRKETLDGKKLKVAVIPFGQDKMVDFITDSGALFHVEYTPEHMKNGKRRALELLRHAIDEKANIILFPEFVCGKKIQKAVQAELERIYRDTPERTEALLLVVAGSRWEKRGNNVADILAYDGHPLGCQYKYVSYSDLGENKKKWVEDLKDPGKECTIVEIDKVGKIMFGICRDIVAESYIALLTEVFSPQLLLIPAWSRSVMKGFKGQLERITSRNQRTCSVLCNCCEAYHTLGSFKKEVGMVVSPVERAGYIDGKTDLILRNEADCTKECKAGGCVFIVDLDCSPKNTENGCVSVSIDRKFKN
ncbi:MAG: carbon-nitrogen hydrolase family protein [Lachnospiraceae bacterium]|nr:carbon-nitrogen hydrolase family protein [Lachnospiraceae bacterium]